MMICENMKNVLNQKVQYIRLFKNKKHFVHKKARFVNTEGRESFFCYNLPIQRKKMIPLN